MADLPDFYPGGADVMLKPDWSAHTGVDKAFEAFAFNQGYGAAINIVYVVPAGKKLYIVSLSSRCLASAAADGELNQFCETLVWDTTDARDGWRQGSNGGIGIILSPPFVVPAGHTISANIYVYANHNCNIYVIAKGYEV